MEVFFEEFKKNDIRVGKVLEVEKIPNSKNLIKLKVDFDSEKRQAVAGLAQFYKPEELMGKEIVVIFNLEPKVLAGIESQGMLLAADVDEKPIILIPEKEVPIGTKVK